jgi:putative ABC transport system permease protein
MPVKTTYKENVAIALQSIGGNRLRTSLTALIIAIGIMALVGILTAIDGIKQQTNAAFASLGANSFTIENQGMELNFGPGGHSKIYPPISYLQASNFENNFSVPSLIAINLDVSGSAVVKYGNKKSNPNISVTGTNENYMLIKGYKLAYGRNFSSTEVTHGDGVVIVGNEIKKQFFKNTDPIGKSIFVGDGRFRIIGVFEPKGSSFGFGGDKICLIPVIKAKQMVDSTNHSFTVSVMASGPNALNAAADEATSLFRNVRDLRVTQANNFKINRSDSIQAELMGNLDNITYGGMAIGAITLIGAAIGLMNIMLVSVTERTREIGLRKAIGATPAIIRRQFLIEAIVICLIGGLAGIFLGMLIGNLIVLLTKGSFVVPWIWITLALIVCTGIGLLSGFYPAKKASKLDPVEALRYE